MRKSRTWFVSGLASGSANGSVTEPPAPLSCFPSCQLSSQSSLESHQTGIKWSSPLTCLRLSGSRTVRGVVTLSGCGCDSDAEQRLTFWTKSSTNGSDQRNTGQVPINKRYHPFKIYVSVVPAANVGFILSTLPVRVLLTSANLMQ